ncbi:MAG: polyprenyl synthetase family protein [Pseudomonadota bacterium]
MDEGSRIEAALDRALAHAEAPGAPPLLAEALRHAVFPGGARVRARLCLAVARACGEPEPAAADAAAAAIELMHCASLVHDDLPCFDDAETRRGKPSVHSVYGEPLAVLAGDALIVLAFETLAREAGRDGQILGRLVTILGRATGMPGGICAGQAWESEDFIDLSAYQRAKTGALFVAACAAGATAAGKPAARWTPLGDRLGEAYQVADDLRDAIGDAAALGKPVGQDEAHDRPNAVGSLGLMGAKARLDALVTAAVDCIPDCPGRPLLEALVRSEAKRLVPPELAAQLAGEAG